MVELIKNRPIRKSLHNIPWYFRNLAIFITTGQHFFQVLYGKKLLDGSIVYWRTKMYSVILR